MVRFVARAGVGALLLQGVVLLPGCGDSSHSSPRGNGGSWGADAGEAGTGFAAAAGESIPSGGLGGEGGQGKAPSDAGTSSVGGESTSGSGGTGGIGQADAGMGAGGDAGASGMAGSNACCQPLTCDQLPEGVECGYLGFDECLDDDVSCECAQGFECVAGQCQACDPLNDPCAEDALLCGATKDRCGNDVVCPDNCEELTLGLGACFQGSCCYFDRYFCASDDCGDVSIGCGVTLDCAFSCENGEACQPSGKCCTPTQQCEPSMCGWLDDGCGNLLACAAQCADDEACVSNVCRPSSCLAVGLECGDVIDAGSNAVESCGQCIGDDACIDHTCVAICAPSAL
jgi:hypothetical protein